jgi:hypothetical protein
MPRLGANATWIGPGAGDAVREEAARTITDGTSSWASWAFDNIIIPNAEVFIYMVIALTRLTTAKPIQPRRRVWADRRERIPILRPNQSRRAPSAYPVASGPPRSTPGRASYVAPAME